MEFCATPGKMFNEQNCFSLRSPSMLYPYCYVLLLLLQLLLLIMRWCIHECVCAYFQTQPISRSSCKKVEVIVRKSCLSTLIASVVTKTERHICCCPKSLSSFRLRQQYIIGTVTVSFCTQKWTLYQRDRLYFANFENNRLQIINLLLFVLVQEAKVPKFKET